MQRGWAGWIVLAGVALGLRWLAESAADARSGRPLLDRPESGPVRPGSDALASAASPRLSTVAARARVPQELSRAAELERAHWVEGRVDLPAGVPDNEACFVVAEGREFSDGTVYRARVGPDGRFRVAFSPRAKAGWVGIEARYLHLPRRTRWVSRRAEEVTLAPELGGVVTGRLVLPASARAESPGGEIELRGTGDGFWRRTAPLRGGEFTFEQVPSGTITLRYCGSAWLASSAPFALAAGATERLELACVAGVVLGGRVRDERGRGIEGARVRVSSFSIRSGRDGAFRLPALEAGDHTLLVSCEQYLPAEKTFASCAAGTRRTNLAMVLRRGASIAGKVLLPDGCTDEVRMRVTPEEPRAGQRSISFQSASDGTFRVQGLLPGSHRLEAWKVFRNDRVTARRAHVAAGTEDLVLQLGPWSSVAELADESAPRGEIRAERAPVISGFRLSSRR